MKNDFRPSVPTKLNALLIGLFLIFSSSSVFAGEFSTIIQSYLSENRTELGLTEADISNWVITDQSVSKKSRLAHVYIQQTHEGIPVFNAVANFNILDGEVLSMGNRLIKDLKNKTNASTPSLSAKAAITALAGHLGMDITSPLIVLNTIGENEFEFSNGDISLRNILVKLTYQPMPEDEIFLAWNVTVLLPDGKNWWNARVDALSGKVLHKNDYITHCEFGEGHPSHSHSSTTRANDICDTPTPPAVNKVHAPDQYNVFAIPVESPNHGVRTLEVDPADLTASPFGWHDTDGSAGAEFTITRGNNVHASEDANADNNPGYSPDGGATLDFDYPLNMAQNPSGYQDPAITNLFYWNNVMHDVWYIYGFDESSGNFQENNYGNGGAGSDYVFADAQDGGGTNNANFGTPPDGQNPRMQMFLWTSGGGATNYLTVNSPGGIAGPYTATDATFGPGVPAIPITQDVIIADDGIANPNVNDACEPLINGAAINGKIALIDRGDCQFQAKVQEAQDNGAVAVIIVNNVGGAPTAMGGTNGNITIPSIMISDVDGAAIKAQINGGTPVNATIVNNTGNFDKDGDFDNVIIAHEYGHGISNRLTGGGNNTSCLGNAEQMGEGWSDWFGLMLTIEPGDASADIRGIGTFATGQPTLGTGIRNEPYSTDFGINNYTYAATNNTGLVSQPHGIGFVWCTMLWDLTWAFIDLYGFDPDVYNGTGGNNLAMQLVTEGMKLQPCEPGFIDGRDAILQADQILNGGTHACLIWEKFAARGLGYSASQGSSNSRTDQTEAFDLPPACMAPSSPPSAAFTANIVLSCAGDVIFTDNSTDVPQGWDWDFGDGNTSTFQNPTHSYTTNGNFTVTLTVTNALGSDMTTQNVSINMPPAPTVVDAEGCAVSSLQLSASGTGDIIWLDGGGNEVGQGPTFNTPPLGTTTTYQAQNGIFQPIGFVGPVDNSFGGGGYHGTGFIGTVNFTAQKPLTIISAWVDAEYAGPRDFFLWDDIDALGTVLQQITVNIPFTGVGRIDLGFEVPSAGDFSIGGSGVDMFRNNNSTAYPYDLAGLMTITGSSAGADFYYYLYDLEVQEVPCLSAPVPVTASIYDADFTFTQNANTITFTDNSSGATSWDWDFGDGLNATVSNPVHQYTASGNYTVILTINNGVCSHTDTVDITIVGIDAQIDNIEVALVPNPAVNSTSLMLSQALSEDATVRLMGIDGRVLQESLITKGQKVKTFDLSGLASGMYFVSMQAGDTSVLKKVIVER